MLKVGITGNIGAGKSYVSSLFNDQFGVPVYYTDVVAKQLMKREAVIEKYIKILGDDIVTMSAIDPVKVSVIIFNDEAKRAAISKYMVGAIKDDFKQWCAIKRLGHVINSKNPKVPYALCESAIFHENETEDVVDLMIGVHASGLLRSERVMERSGCTYEEFRRRDECQMDHHIKMGKCDFTIYNDPHDNVAEQIEKLHNILLKVAKYGHAI